MADDEATTLEQIAEYESQLAGIVELLEASPGDESLLALKKDLEELLELSRANVASSDAQTAGGMDKSESGTCSEELKLPPPPPLPPPPLPVPPEAENGELNGVSSSNVDTVPSPSHLHQDAFHQREAPYTTRVSNPADSAPQKEKAHKVKKSKKAKKVRDFVLPDHLVPHEGDSEAERNKKRRAAKALKSKWRLEKKEIESNNRQKSWQSFQKKSYSSSGSGSIFSTKEGVNDRVGVVSKKQLTEFGARKRHK